LAQGESSSSQVRNPLHLQNLLQFLHLGADH
jgi:hypothetical protein